MANYKIGDQIIFNHWHGQEDGEITRKIDNNSWEVFYGSGAALVENKDIIGLQENKPKKWWQFEKGGNLDYPSRNDRKNKTYYHIIWDSGNKIQDRVFEDKKEAESKFHELVNKGIKFIQLSKDSFNEYGWLDKHNLYMAHPKFAKGGGIGNYGGRASTKKMAFGGELDKEELLDIRKVIEVSFDNDIEADEISYEEFKDFIEEKISEPIEEDNLRLVYEVMKAEEEEEDYAKGGEVGKINKKKLNKIANIYFKVWDLIGAESGGQIRSDKELQIKFAKEMNEFLEKLDYEKYSFTKKDFEYFEDENYHLLNEFLVWNDYFDEEFGEERKKSYLYLFKTYPNSYLDPTLSKVVSKEDKYIPHSKIKSITALIDGKEVVIDGEDVLNGANL